MNHPEGIISEWLENTGYIVARNHKVGRRVKGGWAGELDVITYHAATNHLVHNEPESMFILAGIRNWRHGN